MNKPEQIRSLLLAAVPHLARNPEDLHVFVRNGRVVATAAANNMSFEYQFDLTVVVTDFADHSDRIMVPLLAWVAEHQPELLTNPSKRQNGIRFEVEMIDKGKADIEISLELTERVKVTPVTGGRTVEHLPEPPLDPYYGFEWELYIKGEQVNPSGDK